MKQWMIFISILLTAVNINHCFAEEIPLDLEPSPQQIIKKDTRYLRLYVRNDLEYFLDLATAKKIKHPYLKEELWDVWIKIKENEDAAYTYPEVYTMAHYYVRCTMSQLQLIQTFKIEEEAAVAYAPEVPYREKNWQNLIPGSNEEELYWAILKNVKEN